MSRTRASAAARSSLPESEPLWYKDAVFYELRVRAFQDSDGDGIGDFRGLHQRLDYVQDLGVTALWLLPFCPSPLRDDGYDISDYEGVHPDCGSLDDFKAFLAEAHRRGLRVVTELVINHTSDQHPWFQRARRAPPGSRHRNFYVWSESPDRYSEARVIFKDFESSNWTWDPLAKAYYWHRFYAHQPDLNFDSPDVRKAVFRFLDFWLSLGVDGLRLDAIPYLYERHDTNCENLPETHAFLKDLHNHVEARYRDRVLLAEANQWPEDAAAYFGQGDECHMAFHFPVMPRLFMALYMEDRYPIIDILEQTPAIPETCQWALFLRNHDELTLEMVTDEERDYMYRVYAHDAHARINLGIRRRLAPLLGSDRRRIELMNALLFSLPGTPIIYYGDEIGMGDNFYLGDRNGVRTPMQWSSDRNAGFSTANPQRLYLPVIIDPEFHYETCNVEAQQNNPSSLLRWMKRLISLRRSHHAFGRGAIRFLHTSNHKVLVFVRSHESQCLLVVANLSRFAEYVEIDLAEYEGLTPVELFSGRPFPTVRRQPYLLTLAPHSFYWFRLEASAPEGDVRVEAEGEEPPLLAMKGSWESGLRREGRKAFEAALPAVLRSRRWFGGKALSIRSASLVDTIPLSKSDGAMGLVALARVDYRSGNPETYVVPLRFVPAAAAEVLRAERPQSILMRVEIETPSGVDRGLLIDGLESEEVAWALLDAIRRRRRIGAEKGTLVASRSRAFAAARAPERSALPARVLHGEQSNTTIAYGEHFTLKVYRRLAEGMNPDLEIGRFLTDRARFANTPPLAGALEYQVGRGAPMTLATLQGYVKNEGDAWSYTLDQVQQFFERVLEPRDAPLATAAPRGNPLALVDREPPELVFEIGSYLETARLLGQRTAELHRALARDSEDPDFAPEPFTSLYQRSLYQSIRTGAIRALELLAERVPHLSERSASEARVLLERKGALLEAIGSIVGGRIGGMRFRCHGDFHLGQLLYTGNDFTIIDFEGEPARSLGERRLKRSPLSDVAGMLRSFDYVVHHPLVGGGERLIRDEDVPRLEPWAHFWRQWVSSAYLRAYLPGVNEAGLVPIDHGELERLLRALLFDKATYELRYELNNRPEWVRIPIRGILDLLEN